jgi:hypothetical protein
MRASNPICMLSLSLLSPAFATPPPLGVSAIDIPGDFLEYTDINRDGIRDVVFGRVEGFDSVVTDIGYIPGLPGFAFAEPVTFGFTTSLGRVGNQTITIVDNSGLPTAIIATGTRVQGYRRVEDQLTLVLNETVVPQHSQSDDEFRGLRKGDLDGDGLDELLMYGPNGFIIRWSSRQPFTRYQSFPADGPPLTLPMADYDGDGLTDVLIRSPLTDELLLYPGTGTDKLTGPIGRGVDFSDAAPFIAWDHEMSLGNLDEQPGLDLVYANSNGIVTFELNFATPHRTTVAIPFPLPGAGSPRVIGSLKGERDTVVYRATGVASGPYPWVNPDVVWIDPLGAESEVFVAELHAPQNTFPPPLANWHTLDTDADGVNEIVSFSSGEISIQHLRGCAPGLPQLGPGLGAAGGAVLHTLPIDLDRDGLPELLNTGGVPTILNPRDLTIPPFTIPGITSSGFMSVPYTPVNDGVVRVAMGSNPLRIISFGPDGLPSSIDQYLSPDDGSLLGLVTGDFDGDGLEDIGAVQAGMFQMFRSLGDGTIEWFAQIPAVDWIKPAAADLNGDGLTDLIAGDASGNSISVLINQGGGTFSQVQSWSSTASYWLIAEDLDGDGLLDLAGVNGSTSTSSEISAAVWFGLPGGLFGDPQAIQTNGRATEIVATDLTGNGLKDLVVSDVGPSPTGGSGDQTRIYTQGSPRVFTYSGRLPGDSSTGVAAAHLNADGAIDVITVSNDARRTYIHWGFAPPCPADINCDGQLNFFDLARFVQAFAAGDPSADIAEPSGVWNFFDVSAFIQLFNQGCP